MYQRIKSLTLAKCRQAAGCILYPISDVSIWLVETEIKPKENNCSYPTTGDKISNILGTRNTHVI
jgi:hypothetical protein